MPNITLAVPEEIYEVMKKYTEIRWSEVARQAFEKYIHRLKILEKMEYEEKLRLFDSLLKNSELNEEDVKELDEKVKEGLNKRLQAELK